MKEIKVSSPEEIGLNIKNARKQQGLTQSDLANLANTGVRFISDVENGKENISLIKMLSVLNALGLEIHLINKWG